MASQRFACASFRSRSAVKPWQRGPPSGSACVRQHPQIRFSSSSSSSKKPAEQTELRSPLGSRDAVVENTGSVARDHLANERTFLAWAQVGLAFTAAGTALFTAYHQEREVGDRLVGMAGGTLVGSAVPSAAAPSPRDAEIARRKAHRQQSVIAASALLWGNGGLLLLYSVYRYLTVQRFLREGKFILAKRGLFGVTFATAVCTSGALALVYSS